MSARAALREATAAGHETVDASFGAFDLTSTVSYGHFLTAHARALPAIEAALYGNPALPLFGLRTDALRRDLAILGLSMPARSVVPALRSDAAAFGALYVIEGSRLGGAMLARTVRPDLPRDYLSAIHQPGAWRQFGETFDRAADAGGEAWLAEAITAAEATFGVYAQAASMQR